MRTFDHGATGRLNNFTLVRACAAVAVIVSHAFPLATGVRASEPLLKVGLTLGEHGLIAFFALSGYLVAQSFERRPDLLDFAVGRALRILPAYLMLLAVTVLLVGPWATDLPLSRYARDPDTFRYLWANATFVRLEQTLPGVFEPNPLTSTVNGTLWSLRYEIGCYVILYVAGRHACLGKRFAWAFYLTGMSFSIGCRLAGLGGSLPHLLPSFLTGIFLYVYRGTVPVSLPLFAAAAVLTWSLRASSAYPEVLRITIAYAALAIATGRWSIGLALERVGDYSYGLYLYGWVVEQSLLHRLPDASPFVIIALGLPITASIAALSWHLLERPTLRLRPRVLARLRMPQAQFDAPAAPML